MHLMLCRLLLLLLLVLLLVVVVVAESLGGCGRPPLLFGRNAPIEELFFILS